MAFYDLSKQERIKVVTKINSLILAELESGKLMNTIVCFDDEDTYIRKTAYLSVGRIYKDCELLRVKIIQFLSATVHHESFRVRQTVINAAGEIGKNNFEEVQLIFDIGLVDKHHSPRNAVIGSVKKMGEVNPMPVLKWARGYLRHSDKEIRREICHGIELRGRKHPQDILPLLKELQYDKVTRVRDTLVHVIGQIAYKKGCLEIVVHRLNHWENKELVADAIEEIIDVHRRYRDFAVLTEDQARDYILKHYMNT